MDAETPASKTCPKCAEEIKAAALVCPHCRAKLGPRKSRRGLAIAAVGAVAAVALFLGFGEYLESQSYAGMHDLYASLGKPECLTDADLEQHVDYIVNASTIPAGDRPARSLSPAEARESIEKSLRDHVPNEWWTRSALYPQEEPASTAPPTKPCSASR